MPTYLEIALDNAKTTQWDGYENGSMYSSDG